MYTNKTSKQYHYVSPSLTRQQMIRVLVKGLERSLTDQEARLIHWLGDCEFETRGVILDLFKELAERQKL